MHDFRLGAKQRSVVRRSTGLYGVKISLRNHLSDSNLSLLMNIPVEGPQLSSVPFEEILDIFKLKNKT